MQESALDRVVGAADRGLVRRRGVGGAACAPEQVSADRVKQAVVSQIEAVDHVEGRAGALHLRERHGAVQGDDGAWRERQELVVELQDLAPIRRGRCCRVTVDGIDRGLDLVRPRPYQLQTLPNNGLPLPN